MSKCAGKNAGGGPCRMAAIRGTKWCWNHSPDKAAERAKSRRSGGQKRHSPHAGDVGSVADHPRTIQDLFLLLDYCTRETTALDNGVQRNSLIKSIVQAYGELIKITELEARVQALEEGRK